VRLDRGLGDVDTRRDLLVGQSGRDQRQHLGLPGRQPVRQRSARDRDVRVHGRRAERVDEVVLHGRVERGPAGQHGVQRPLDVAGTGVLGEKLAGAGPQRVQHRPVVRVRGQRDHPGRVPLVPQPADRLDAVAYHVGPGPAGAVGVLVVLVVGTLCVAALGTAATAAVPTAESAQPCCR
jgi:hypothetical protein